MKSFKQFVDGSERSETVEELEEGTLRNLGSAALAARILALSRKIKRTKDVGEKLDLVASQNTHLGALGLAVGKFLEKSKR